MAEYQKKKGVRVRAKKPRPQKPAPARPANAGAGSHEDAYIRPVPKPGSGLTREDRQAETGGIGGRRQAAAGKRGGSSVLRPGVP